MEHGTGGEGDTGQKPQRSLTGEEDGQKWQIYFLESSFWQQNREWIEDWRQEVDSFFFPIDLATHPYFCLFTQQTFLSAWFWEQIL